MIQLFGANGRGCSAIRYVFYVPSACTKWSMSVCDCKCETIYKSWNKAIEKRSQHYQTHCHSHIHSKGQSNNSSMNGHAERKEKMCSKNLWWARCVCEYQSPSCFCTLFANFFVYAFGYSIGYFQLHFSLLYVLFCATNKKEIKNSNNTKSAHFLCHSSVANVCAMIEMFWPRFFAPTTNIANAVGCQYLFWFDC